MERSDIQNEPVEVTLKVTDVFEKLSVPHLIGGSLASALYGMIRTTQDSDIAAEMRLEHLQPFLSALQDEFYIDEEMIADSIEHNTSFNIIHRETMFKVDVFIPRPRPFLRSQLARTQKEYERIVWYTLNNPVKAGLVEKWEDWKFTFVSRK